MFAFRSQASAAAPPSYAEVNVKAPPAPACESPVPSDSAPEPVLPLPLSSVRRPDLPPLLDPDWMLTGPLSPTPSAERMSRGPLEVPLPLESCKGPPAAFVELPPEILTGPPGPAELPPCNHYNVSVFIRMRKVLRGKNNYEKGIVLVCVVLTQRICTDKIDHKHSHIHISHPSRKNKLTISLSLT